MSTIDKRRNYYALCLAILNEEYSAQKALQEFGIKTTDKRTDGRGRSTPYDSEEIRKKFEKYVREGGKITRRGIQNCDYLPNVETVQNHLGYSKDLVGMRREYS